MEVVRVVGKVLLVASQPLTLVHSIMVIAPWITYDSWSSTELPKRSSLGSVITFHQADPIEFLQLHTKNYDAAILVHCIRYFSSPEGVVMALHDATQAAVESKRGGKQSER
ncbi:hypothetical protein PROFUN_02459 [Planoprotostelium fungivorum]|uniref:Uncharacterized protein n=1 Tax=Planoprotostelium fungivorum TaxID=1890364 RepID=A0A2P6NUX7_9EUKA|nr:hypothetical protein PROFUN_02459 [Planoprotostelium fungivorum]